MKSKKSTNEQTNYSAEDLQFQPSNSSLSQKDAFLYSSESTHTSNLTVYTGILTQPSELIFIIPENTKIILENLAIKLNIHKNKRITEEKLAFIVSEVTKYTYNYENNGCKLNKVDLGKRMGTANSEVALLITALCDEKFGVLKVIKGYKVGVSSTRYILRDGFIGGELLFIDYGDTTLRKHILKMKTTNSITDSKLSLYKSVFNKLSLSLPSIPTPHFLMMENFSEDKLIKTASCTAFRSYFSHYSLLQIIHKNFRVTRPDPLSRVHTNLTNLSREFRYFLRCDDKSLWEVDIRNSQPLIATLVIWEYLQKQGFTEMPADLLLYKEDCEKGRFYDYFMQLNDTPEEKRSDFKDKFFEKVFFGSVKNDLPKLCKQFQSRYPNCYEAICAIKGGVGSGTHNEFSIQLQRAEAQIIFDEVNIGLLESGIPAFNIFDSILHLPEHKEIVEERIRLAFAKRGLYPTLNTKKYDTIAA